ncbi:LuxR C-terminal-related transcriptional regulator [Phytopseudomonas dryadis]|uniref:LuxR family transcriptional regulator n=1 Tax=Phytopseudomonas dryadis TaxID=2487520 RepID=A0A4Q9QWP8_9GAMM|nr:LuxR C-terminal-related transcriptional regulator [Pseudomonas dryadis]TBU86923.1 LuxR family transcriptional regulator [Pseudomonas dryadis]
MTSSPAVAPLLSTKLSPGEPGQPLLARPALLERLLAQREQRLLILCTPAGYGKSTLLAQLRQHLLQQDTAVAWLTCEEADSEPRRLLRYLLAAVERQLPGFADTTAGLLRSEANLPHETLLDAFIADLAALGKALYLMLDDFHRIRHPALTPLVTYLIEHLPDNVQLIASSRQAPRFSEAPAGQRACWIDAGDLRLSLAETTHYLREIHHLPLEEAQIGLLHARSEGWITGLQLAAQALARHGDPQACLARLSGTERDLADYFAEDVTAHLPEALQRFLEQTSVLDEFNAELCTAITGHQDAEPLLERLQHAQLFIEPLDDRGEWLRYHPLFAEFFQGRLARHGDPTHLLHTAARWCASQQQVDRAVRYALRARDYAFAAELLERQGAGLIAGNRVYGVLAMLKEIPAQVIQEHPVLQIFYAWQLAFEQQYADAEALIEDVSQRLLHARGQPLRMGLAELLGAAQVLKALVLLYQDKLEACLVVARHWLSLVPDNQPVFRASLSCVQAAAHGLLGEFGDAASAIAIARDNLEHSDSDYLHVMVNLIEALICKELGQLERGCVLAENARARAARVFGRHSRVSGPLSLAYADLLYEQDRHAAILAELPLATTWRDVATPLELISRGQLVMARARFFAGAGEPALHELDAWLNGLHGPGYERVYAQAMGCKVQFLLWLRRVNDAERACLLLRCHLQALPAARYSDAATALVLCEARLALDERRADKAQAALEACLNSHAAEPHQRDRRLRLSLLLSVAYWRRGQQDKAFKLVQATLEDAWDSGYRRLFLDDAPCLLPLWQAWFAVDPQRAGYWQGLAEQLREQLRRLDIDPQHLDEHQDISHREREILRFVAAGLSNRDIAQAVHLSEATIKWHLHNLFAKLGVRSRTQAVIKGKSLGLVSEQ